MSDAVRRRSALTVNPVRMAERALDQHSVSDLGGRRPFGLFDPQGRWLAGNLHKLPNPLPRLEEFFETRVNTAQEHTVYRSILHKLPNGNLIVVSRNIEEFATLSR